MYMNTFRHSALLGALVGAISTLSSVSAIAADQTVPGQGNAAAIKLAGASPLVQSAFELLHERLARVHSQTIRHNMSELLDDKVACIQHRANLKPADQAQIIATLEKEGLLYQVDGKSIVGGVTAGVFPPVLQDGGKCPKMPQPLYSAPGGATGGHHSEPGGLPVHEAFNDTSALGLANSYKVVYSHTGKDGLPIVAKDSDGEASEHNKPTDKINPAFNIDGDIVLAAPLWHDWAKTMVFQWNSDGTEFTELNFGGNGVTDNYGAAGNSQTGAHHIIGLAEAMKRGLPADFVISVASAHSVPTSGNEYKVVNWLRAAAIIAQIDPVATGYLQLDAKGHLRLPALRHLGDVDLNAAPVTQTNILVEYILHNLSDSDFYFTGPAATDVGLVLAKLAHEFGYDTAATNYTFKFRHPVLSYLSAERLYILYSNGGIDAVRQEVKKLKKLSII
jgi:hypothetical protein